MILFSERKMKHVSLVVDSSPNAHLGLAGLLLKWGWKELVKNVIIIPMFLACSTSCCPPPQTTSAHPNASWNKRKGKKWPNQIATANPASKFCAGDPEQGNQFLNMARWIILQRKTQAIKAKLNRGEIYVLGCIYIPPERMPQQKFRLYAKILLSCVYKRHCLKKQAQ